MADVWLQACLDVGVGLQPNTIWLHADPSSAEGFGVTPS